MKNSEFLDFLSNKETPPPALKMSVQKDITLSLKGRSILSRFLFLQLMGAMFSLSICPQFGIGLAEGHGIAHYFRSFGDLACASFCGSLFLSSGLVLSIFGMKGEEVWWVWKHHKVSLMLLPSVLWAVLMLVNRSLNLDSESVLYNMTWIVVAASVQILWMQIRSGVYLKGLSLKEARP